MQSSSINVNIEGKFHPVNLKNTLIAYINKNSDHEKRSRVISALNKPRVDDLTLESAAKSLTDFFAVLDKFFAALLRGTPTDKGKLKLIPFVHQVTPFPLQFTNVSSLDEFKQELYRHGRDIELRLKVIEQIGTLIEVDHFTFNNKVFDEFLGS